MSANDAVVQLRGELRDLEARKEALELEIESAQSWLTSQGLDPAQLPLRLTDAEGFPLPNVDHHAARIHAQSMRTALNDHKRVVARLADVLGEYHDAMRNNKAPAEVPVTQHQPLPTVVSADERPTDIEVTEPGPPEAAPLIAFAVIDSVDEGSPAFTAGCRTGDRILQFGSVNLARHQSERDALGAVGELVHRSVERPIAVVIARDGFADPITIVVTPRRWDGRGLLGCHLQPFIPFDVAE
ncbi:Nas2 N-terminal domain-containing protein [Plasmodiophora brassicae]|nr:hypothetical protein PBRA_003931 [Plasmodiophora brassicae]